MSISNNIHTEFHRFLSRKDKERLLGQKGLVLWLYGLSGSGKSTIANIAERELHKEGRMSVILDGDNLRSGLNEDLGFSDEDRVENIRRNSEVAQLFSSQGVITLVSLICPRRELRALARNKIGEDFIEVFVKADYVTCARRDPKGLYAKAESGNLSQFTGRDSGFEEPEGEADLVLDTDKQSAEDSAQEILDIIRSRSSS